MDLNEARQPVPDRGDSSMNEDLDMTSGIAKGPFVHHGTDGGLHPDRRADCSHCQASELIKPGAEEHRGRIDPDGPFIGEAARRLDPSRRPRPLTEAWAERIEPGAVATDWVADEEEK